MAAMALSRMMTHPSCIGRAAAKHAPPRANVAAARSNAQCKRDCANICVRRAQSSSKKSSSIPSSLSVESLSSLSSASAPAPCAVAPPPSLPPVGSIFRLRLKMLRTPPAIMPTSMCTGSKPAATSMQHTRYGVQSSRPPSLYHPPIKMARPAAAAASRRFAAPPSALVTCEVRASAALVALLAPEMASRTSTDEVCVLRRLSVSHRWILT